MALTRQEIAHRASRVRSANARRRRFQRYVREMRQAGLIVIVREGIDGSAETRIHPDYALTSR